MDSQKTEKDVTVEWLIEGEDGTKMRTSEDVATAVASGSDRFSFGPNGVPVTTAYSRTVRVVRSEWEPLLPTGGGSDD